MAALSHDPLAPEQQEVVERVDPSQACTLIDLNEQHAIDGAKLSLLMNSEVAKKLISILSKPKPTGFADQKAHELLKTFIIRGYFHLYKTLGNECVSFLQSLGQSGDLIQSLLKEAVNDVLKSDQHIVSETQLEMLADSCRNTLAEADDLQYSFGFQFALKESGENAFTIHSTDYRFGEITSDKDFACKAIHGSKGTNYWSHLIPTQGVKT